MPKAEYRGVTIEGPAPVAWFDLRFEPGVDVFYGLNGAGKSRLLAGLQHAMGGAVVPEGVSYLTHVHLAPEFDREFESQLEEDMCSGLDPLDLRFLPDEPWSLDSSELTELAVGALERVCSVLRTEVDDDLAWARDVSFDIVMQGNWVLDRRRDGRYSVDVAVRYEDASPALRATLDQLRSYALDDDDSGGHDPRIIALHSALANYGDARSWIRLLDHPWAAAPVFSVGVIDAPRIVSLFTEDAEMDLDREVASVLRQRAAVDAGWSQDWKPEHRVPILESVVDGTPALMPGLLDAVHRIENSANRILTRLLLDAPTLKADLTSPDEWFVGAPPIRWSAQDPSGERVPIDHLSQAQKRWTRFALRLAIATEQPDQPERTVVMVDEPEAALHPTAERFLAAGIDEVAGGLGVQVLLASHSPAFLANSSFRLHHVVRNSAGLAEAVPLTVGYQAEIESLGLDRADLLLLSRVFLVVEGRHDELVIDGLIGPELSHHRAAILPMRGGGSAVASVIDARLLFDYTSARLMMVLDNVSGKRIVALWADARKLASDGDLAEARLILDRGLDNKVSEEKFLKEFCIRALEHGRADRIEVFGLAKADIQEYLPAWPFVGNKAESWEEMRSRYADYAEGYTKGKPQNFKSWIANTYGGKFDDEQFHRALESMDEIPEEFTTLLERVSKLSEASWLARPDPP